ncbi:S-methyl-5'-thioadenosine phosphorylase [Nanoarchaeota archaeon]
MVKVGIIGGSGLDDPDIMKDAHEVVVDTPYGKPSSSLTVGKIGEVEVVVLARHGKKHDIAPTQVNFRANIQALKDQGVTHILAATAVGSLRDEMAPGHLVFPDQAIDFTKQRKMTFFDQDKVVHTPMADPFNSDLRRLLGDTADALGYDNHKKGTIVTIEGPRFSTRAESFMFIKWGADIINMSTCPEVFLAAEAGIPYAATAMSTDYDCWKEEEEPVTFEMVMATMAKNADKVKKLFVEVVGKIK